MFAWKVDLEKAKPLPEGRKVDAFPRGMPYDNKFGTRSKPFAPGAFVREDTMGVIRFVTNKRPTSNTVDATAAASELAAAIEHAVQVLQRLNQAGAGDEAA